MSEVATHPVQRNTRLRQHEAGKAPQSITLAAYEVYKEVYSEQKALITGACRGGFGTGELIAFLYARGFPRAEWRMRVDEALRGLEL